MPAIAMKHDVNPVEKIYKALGNIDHIEVFNDRVLVAIYELPERTAGGIFTSEQSKKESKFQGKACLVIKVGPMANVGDKGSLRGGDLKPGDWVALKVSDGWQMEINGQLCKLMAEETIHMRIPGPDVIW